ncbi:MAG: enhancing lycopene biosynthesis protein 2 [Zhongshania marina]|jgi:enhancing lycopene biosynthesis protein 2|uniref:Glyoxalase n=1 Tax=Zhongshania marina TaxID=2304603 RepID=A0A2S4HDU8_9GAMM|nr:isoprenoid biosynthesis glyoxalase ElbB [Marortus luteolus]POP52162.1 isoprenoid biosynthesis protein ElbB [Marortus luteolus]RNL67282.1 isoprenoid biosynthesis protein ElbB [Zhongshania marina]
MKKVALILSGCGVYDGSEIYESVLTMLSLENHGASYQCFAPNIEQLHVINHLAGEVAEGESRNVLVESARLARGEVKDLAQAQAADFDAVIVPGGFGAAKNLSDFAVNGAQMSVQKDVLQFVQAMHKAGKPTGLICIAPTMAARIFGDGVKCTVGNDADVATAINNMGALHQTCLVDEVCIDEAMKLVTTPAYMLAGSIAEAAKGINRCVREVLNMA